MTDRDSAERRLDRLIDECLARLADGEDPDLEAALDELEEPELREGFLVAVLAEEFMLRLSKGEAVSLEDYVARLETEESAQRLRQYVQDSRRAGRFLPRGLAPGMVLAGKYRIVREIGRGGLSIIYAAVDETLDHELAIKVFNREASPEMAEGWEELVRRESQVLAGLTSRNIVTVHAAERDGEHSFIVMDLVPGRDLFTLLRNMRGELTLRAGDSRRRTERIELLESSLGRDAEGEYEDLLAGRTWYRTVGRIARRAAHALELAHDAGILHRDLKPQNLVLVPGGEPVLLDFGLAAGDRRGAPLDEGGLHGTVEYLAPEQARSLRTGSDPRTDLYQLGLILYELLTLEPAFVRDPAEDLGTFLERKRAGEVRPPTVVDPRVPRALDAICRHALAPELDGRYRSARELRFDLERFDRGLPPRYAPLSTIRAAGMWATHLGRRPVVAASVVAVAVLAAVLFFTGADWPPPAVAPFWKEEEEDLVFLAREQVIEVGKKLVLGIEVRKKFVLGIQVSNAMSTVVYALGLEGDGEDRDSQFLVPLTPELLGRPTPSAGKPVGLELEPGRHEVSCSFVMDEPRAYEGFVVYALEKGDPRNALFEEWLEHLWLRDQRTGAVDPITYREAMDMGSLLFEDGGRAGSGAEVTAEERLLLFGDLEASEETPTDDWKETGFLREEFLFRIKVAEEDPPVEPEPEKEEEE